MRIGMVTDSLGSMSFDEMVETAASLGIETVEFGGALVGNDDYGDFSKDESPIGRSMISHDFITNKIKGN